MGVFDRTGGFVDPTKPVEETIDDPVITQELDPSPGFAWKLISEVEPPHQIEVLIFGRELQPFVYEIGKFNPKFDRKWLTPRGAHYHPKRQPTHWTELVPPVLL